MSDNKPKNKMASKSGSTKKETSKAPTKDKKENSTENMDVFAALAHYKLEFESSQKKLENVQVKLRGAHEGLERHQRKQEAMSEQIKGLTQEKTTLQQNCDKLSGRCRYFEAEFNKVTKENTRLVLRVKKACDDVDLFKIHNHELRDRVATIPLLEKNLENMQLKDKKQTLQLQETLSELEKSNEKYRQNQTLVNKLQKAADAAEMETNSMRRALLKKYNEQTQQREKMDQLQNHIKVMQKNVTVYKRDKEAADESKKALMVAISESEEKVKAKNEELVAVAAQVKTVEHRVRQKAHEVTAISNKCIYFQEKVSMQAALIQQLKSENLDVRDKVMQQQAAIESTSHALNLTQTQADSLLKQVAQMKAQEEMMRSEEGLLKVQLEDNNKQFKAAVNKFQTELAKAQVQHDAYTSEIQQLKKLISCLKSSQSRAEAEAAELRTQTKVLRSEVKEEKLGKQMVVYKTARKTHLFHRYRKKMADKRELFSTMTTMLNAKVCSVRTSPTHSEQEVAELRMENQELKEKLENRPDEPFKQLYWAKKTINKQHEKITLLKAECMMYYNLSSRKTEESEALQQEVNRLKQQEVTQRKHQEVTRLNHEVPNQRAHMLTGTRIPAAHTIPVFNEKGLIVSGIVMGGRTLKEKKLLHKRPSLEPNHI